jgi:hypothetical protein
LKYGTPTEICWPFTASTISGNTVPSSTTNANAANATLLARNAASRDSGESIRPGARSRSPRQPIRPTVTATTIAKKPRIIGPMPDSVNACTESSTPDRVRNVPRIVSENVAHSSDRFHTRSIPRRSCTITECRNAVPVSHGRNDAFSTGSHAQ